MSERGGPTTQSGIRYQNSVAALYVGRLCDTTPRPDAQAVVKVRVEAPEHVDDIVVTFADDHQSYLQCKERVISRSNDWKELWQDFSAQFQEPNFRRGRDRLLLLIGESRNDLQEACNRTSGSETYSEWWARLTRSQRSLVERIKPLLSPELLSEKTLLEFFKHIDIEIWSLKHIERDLVPTWMPESNEQKDKLFRLLRDLVGDKASHRGIFTADQLLKYLQTQNVHLKVNDQAHISPQQSPSTRDLTEHRKNALAHAKRFIETKSRALKPTGVLPKFLPLVVSLHVQGLRHRFDNQGALITDPRTRVSMPLFDAARQSRNTLLLGDMGTGKSTSLGLSVERVCQENEQCLAFIIPAREIRLKPSYTLKRLLRAASKYFNEQISPTTTPIDIESLLNSGIDVFIGIDGLDEISKKEASDMLRQFGALVMNWSNLQVLVTGRPVELLGVSYEDWQVLTTVALDNDEKMRLFEAEASADGRTEDEAKDLAIRLMRKLNSLPNVNVLATSPLVIRLLYPRLLSMQDGRALTIGDLLFELIRERLRKWAERDAKQTPAPFFEKRYPDEHSRSFLLGRLALKLSGHKAIQLEEARVQLRNLIKSSGESDIDVLADEALHFFEQSGLVLVNEEIEFPIQPFFEALCGSGLATLWEESSESEGGVALQEWRIVSFAAATGRRLGLADNLRPRLLNFIRELLSSGPNAPAASYIVSESRDSTCAEEFISSLKTLGPRPLTLFQSERQQSARTIAESIKLAGEARI